MSKIDYKKQAKELYGPSQDEFSFVEVPNMKFLSCRSSLTYQVWF